MAHPISYRPSDKTRAMIDEMIAYYNNDVPGVLNMALATQYRKFQQEADMDSKRITISGKEGDVSARVWETHVGNATAEEFVAGYDSPADAVEDFVNQYPEFTGQPLPVFWWPEANAEYTLAEMLTSYLDDHLETE